jgi:hypothetical protein
LNYEDQEEIKSIINTFEVSTRTKNLLLKRDEINSREKLLDYYLLNRDFHRIRNCGKKSNLELVHICKELSAGIELIENKVVELDLDELPFSLQKLLKQILDKQISQLSSRATRLVNSGLENQKSKVEPHFFLNTNFNDFLNLENVGSGTINELKRIQRNIYKAYNKLQANQYDSKTQQLELSIDLLDISTDIAILIKSTIKYDNYFPYFKVCSILIKKRILFNKTETYIIQNYLQYFQGISKSSLEECGNQLNLTRERVRQLRNKIVNKFSDAFNFLFLLEPFIDLESDYNINLNGDYVSIDEKFVSNINKKDNTNFTALTIAKLILSISNKYVLIGYELNYHTKQQKRSEPVLNGVYLISKDLKKKFNEKKFLLRIKEIEDNGVSETYRVPLKGYISKFINDFDIDNDLEILNIAANLCTDLIIYETKFQVSEEGKIVFLRNRKRSNSLLVKTALEELGFSPDGHHISKVADKIKEIAPSRDLNNKLDSIRAVIINDSSTFISIGRTSTYGLKIWQEKHSGFRGGTIRDIAEEFLDMHNEPKHISSITEYVNKFRDTNRENVGGNLSLDKSGTFQVFSNNFFGLTSKSYSDESLEFNDVNGGNFTKQSLKKYLPDYYETVIANLSSSLDLKKIQVKSVIDGKIKDGSLIVKGNNILIQND